MKIDFAVVCDYAVIDQYGKLSVMASFITSGSVNSLQFTHAYIS